jgi:hypothetical protein
MKHRHRKERKKLVTSPTLLEIQLLGAKCEYFTVCLCGAIYYKEQWIDNDEQVRDITGQSKFEIMLAMKGAQ